MTDFRNFSLFIGAFVRIKEPSPQTTNNNKTQKIINNIKITFVPQDKKDLNRKRTYIHKLSGIYIYIYIHIDNSTFFSFSLLLIVLIFHAKTIHIEIS